jgi:hypothetical protein
MWLSPEKSKPTLRAILAALGQMLAQCAGELSNRVLDASLSWEGKRNSGTSQTFDRGLRLTSQLL